MSMPSLQSIVSMLHCTYEVSCPAALIQSHLLDCALYLEQVECLAVYLDRRLEDGLHFSEFARISCDEVDVMPDGAGGAGRCSGHSSRSRIVSDDGDEDLSGLEKRFERFLYIHRIIIFSCKFYVFDVIGRS